jgi:hypothetical protein
VGTGVVLKLKGGECSPATGLSNGANLKVGRDVLPARQQVKVRSSADFRDILGRSGSDLTLLRGAAA